MNFIVPEGNLSWAYSAAEMHFHKQSAKAHNGATTGFNVAPEQLDKMSKDDHNEQ